MNLSRTIFLLLFLTSIVNAQLKMPILSPKASVNQQVGISSVIINYNRPSLRGRKLLGEKDIPFGTIWRMGANDVTTFSVDYPIKIEGKELPKGKYALVSIPGETEWTIILNNDAKQWGVYAYDQKKDVLRFNVKVTPLTENVETMSFSFEDVLPSSSSLVFRWEKVQFKIKLEHDADKFVMEQIRVKTTKLKPDAWDLIEAAEYYLLKDRDLAQALKWVNKALITEKTAFPNNLKAQIAQKLGQCDLAIEAAKKAIIAATKSKDLASIASSESIIAKCQSK
jgi:Protein of unknown function (DUF2911)